MPFTFRPIRLDYPADLETAYAFRMERISPDFDPELLLKPLWPTAEVYGDWLRVRQQWDAGAVTHVWDGEEIVGQIECYRAKHDENVGYVNFYYLIPTLRRQGLGGELVTFTDRLFRHRGMVGYQLSTTEENASARKFYAKNGFAELGPRPDKPGHILLGKEFRAG